MFCILFDITFMPLNQLLLLLLLLLLYLCERCLIQGLIRVRRHQQWDFIAEDEFFASSPIRCIEFDDLGRAWIGDNYGRVKVLRFDEHEAELQEVTTLKDQQITPSIKSSLSVVTSPSRWGASLLGGMFRCDSSGTAGSATQPIITAASAQPRMSPPNCQVEVSGFSPYKPE
jgi:hypothetical protein